MAGRGKREELAYRKVVREPRSLLFGILLVFLK